MTHRHAVLALTLLTAACSDNLLPDAIFPNTIDTLTLGSVHDTPVPIPSAYSIAEARAVRTDLSASFDFVYLRSVDGRDLLLPLDAVGLGTRNTEPGLQHSTLSFDALVDPPNSGYIWSDSLEVSVGDVLVGRSRICFALSVPHYAKLEILALDPAARTITFRVVANQNCGYRNLGPGVPED